MSRKRILQIGATVVIVCGAVGYLLASGIAGGEYYKHVDEIMQNPQAWQGKRLQVHGRVVKSSIQRRLTARTTLEVSADGVMAKCPSKYEAKKLPAVN